MEARVVELPDGWAGTHLTVREAQRLVDESLTDPLVVTTAQHLVRNLPERDQWAEAQAISRYVREHIRYTNEGIETIKSPRRLLEEIRKYGRAVGDCDDHVILWAALHKALGHPVRFTVVSQRPDGAASHIYGETYIRGRGWVADDLIVKHQPLGWRIPRAEITREVRYMAGLAGLGGLYMAACGAYGGARVMAANDLRVPRPGYFRVRPMISQRYAVVTRGASHTVSGIGFIPGVIAAVQSALPGLKQLTRKARKKAKRAAAKAAEAERAVQVVSAPAPTPADGITKYIPYIALAVGGLLLFTVLRR